LHRRVNLMRVIEIDAEVVRQPNVGPSLINLVVPDVEAGVVQKLGADIGDQLPVGNELWMLSRLQPPGMKRGRNCNRCRI
jgi:hypothetical protein